MTPRSEINHSRRMVRELQFLTLLNRKSTIRYMQLCTWPSLALAEAITPQIIHYAVMEKGMENKGA